MDFWASCVDLSSSKQKLIIIAAFIFGKKWTFQPITVEKPSAFRRYIFAFLGF